MRTKRYLFLDFPFASLNVLPIYSSKILFSKFQFRENSSPIFTLSKTRPRIFIPHCSKYHPEELESFFLSTLCFLFSDEEEKKKRRRREKTHGKRRFYERDSDEINRENDESPGQAPFSSISLWGKGGEFYGGLAMERR